MADTLPLALLLARGELRVQGLSGRHPLLTAAEAAAGGGVLVVVALKVRHLLLAGTGAASLTSTALLTLGLGAVLVLNVLVLGSETRTGVADLLRWARPLPLVRAEVRRLVVLSGLLRALLFTAVLVAGVAGGALSCADGPWRALQVVACALVLPLSPVALGLRLGATRTEPLPQAALAVPMGVVLLATAVHLPAPAAALSGLVHLVALPALVLLGTGSAGSVVALLLGALVATALAMQGLDLAAVAPASRPARAGVLLRCTTRDPLALAVDLVGHRVGGRHLLQASAYGLLPGLGVLLVVQATTAPVELVALLSAGLALPAVVAGYAHLVPATTLPADAQAWLATTPVPAPALRTVAHLLRTLSAACSATVLAVTTGAVLVGLGRADLAAPLALASLLSAGSLGGWAGRALGAQGWRRALAYYVLLGTAAVRAVAVTAVALAAPVLLALVLVLVLDLTIGGVGQCLLQPRSSRPPSAHRVPVPAGRS